MRKKDREKSVEKNAYFDAYYSNKICVRLALFFTDYGAENALKNRQNKHFFCAETSTFFGAFSVPKENYCRF